MIQAMYLVLEALGKARNTHGKGFTMCHPGIQIDGSELFDECFSRALGKGCVGSRQKKKRGRGRPTDGDGIFAECYDNKILGKACTFAEAQPAPLLSVMVKTRVKIVDFR